MKTHAFIVLWILVWMLQSSCSQLPTYEKHIKELDSLKIVLNQAADNFKQIDSLGCVDYYNQYYTYSQFVNKSGIDTISATDAENLQLFYTSGNTIKEYLEIRNNSLQKVKTVNTQLVNLMRDLKSGAIKSEDAITFINAENQAARACINDLKTSTTIIQQGIDNFNKTVVSTELFIKNHNQNNLPAIIKPNIRTN